MAFLDETGVKTLWEETKTLVSESMKEGTDGATFTPSVSATGDLSWTNDKGLVNPAVVNIMGPAGPKGDTGATGPQGEKGEPGADGTNGKDGVSVTHKWNGTTLSVTSASGTSSVDLKGDKGDKGDTGAQGEVGPRGEQGIQGIQGPKGDKGDRGIDGTSGEDGLSVYHTDCVPSFNPETDGLEYLGSNIENFADRVIQTGDMVFCEENSSLYYVHDYVGGEYVTVKLIGSLKGEKGDKGADGSAGVDGKSLWHSLAHPDQNPETNVYEYLIDAIVTNRNRTLQNGDYIFSKDNCCLYHVSGYAGGNVVPVELVCNLKGAKGDKGDTGEKGDVGSTGARGQRGTGLLAITTAPSSYTTEVGGVTPTYRIALSTVKTQAGVSEVLVGDTIRYSYYHYPIIHVDASYAYCRARVSIRGASGAAGKDGADYSFDPTVYRLHILHLTGDTTGMTKETEVTLSYECNDKDGTTKAGSCAMKWQGSSSLAWDKKNYTIKFDNAFEVVEGWGSQKKYCLKANWIDHSQSRNVVSAKLWGLVRKDRSNLPAQLKGLPNAGAIDGFPVIIMLNGEFHGLYSWNIPKDAWMFGMGNGTKEAIVGADNQADDTAFKAETLLDAYGWELEYNSSSLTSAQVKTSLNNLIKACINSWGGDLDTEVAKYLDWESAIDYYIFAVILQGGDMITKNTILATFDGVKWYFSAYDMDTTYGLEFDGSGLVRAVTTSHTTFETIAETHRVFELIKRFKTNELKARYKALRANALSESRICQYFENYAWDISSPLLVEEVKRWPSVRGSSVNGIDQICRWVRQRLEVCDAWVEALPAQETPIEPEEPSDGYTNLVPTSTDTDGSIYNGTGYKDNSRLSSSGGVSGSAQTGSVVTGFIPWKAYDVIRMKGAEWIGATANHQGHYYLSFYNSNKTLISEGYVTSDGISAVSTQVSAVYDETTGVTTFEFINTSITTGFNYRIKDAKYFRINAYGKGADLIITVNEEIEV